MSRPFKPSFSRNGWSCESAKVAKVAPPPSTDVADRVVTELGGSLIREVPAGELPPIWDGLTIAEREAEMRAWCKRNRVSYPEGFERLREAEIDRLAKADGWEPGEVVRLR